MSQDLKTELQTYVRLIGETVPELARSLKKGLSRIEVATKVKKAGLTLPENHFCLFELFNGQKGLKTTLLPCPLHQWNGLRVGSLDLMESWRDAAVGAEYFNKNGGPSRETRAGRGASRYFWNRNWPPFADGELPLPREMRAVQTTLFLDFDPASEGRCGQVVYQVVEREVRMDGLGSEVVTRSVVASSLSEYFAGVNEAIATGVLVSKKGAGLCWRNPR